MSRPEFPNTPINVQKQDRKPSHLAQLPFDVPEVETLPEVILGHCIITGVQEYRKLKQGNEWRSGIHTQPDLHFPDQEEHAYEARATGRIADMIQKKHLRPGDAVLFRGYTYKQDLKLEGGILETVDCLSITFFEVISKSPRVSKTVFELEQNGSQDRSKNEWTYENRQGG